MTAWRTEGIVKKMFSGDLGTSEESNQPGKIMKIL